MEVLRTLLPLLISISLAALVLAVGLDATRDDLLYLVRRPRLLARAFIAISVIVPAAAVLVLNAMTLPLPVKVGVILMALAPVPPLVPGKDLKLGGRKAYVYGLYVVFAVLAVVIVPATVAVLNRLYGASADVSLMALTRTVLISVLAPLVVGLALRARWPGFAGRAAPWVSRLSLILLIVVCIPLIIGAWSAITAFIGDGVLLAIGLVVIAAIAGGHLLGGPDPQDRAALAGAAATRHPGIALMIASANAADKRVVGIILLFVLVSALLVSIYQAILKRAAKPRGAHGARTAH